MSPSYIQDFNIYDKYRTRITFSQMSIRLFKVSVVFFFFGSSKNGSLNQGTLWTTNQGSTDGKLLYLNNIFSLDQSSGSYRRSNRFRGLGTFISKFLIGHM